MLEPSHTSQQLRRMTEDEIIRQAKNGCRSSTEYLLRKYHGLVETRARSYFLLGAERDDVIQEGRIGLLKAIRGFSGHWFGGFRSFAATCVTRQIISAVKCACRHKHSALNLYVSMDAGEVEGEETSLRDLLPGDRALCPETVVLGRELGRRVSGAIDRSLSELERDVLRQYVQGRSYRDIALKLGTNLKQIDNALQRAKKKLHQEVRRLASPD